MLAIAPGWELKVERGPGCIWVRIEHQEPDCSDDPPLAEQVWALMERHFVSRLVLDLAGIDLLNGYLIGQLEALERQIGQHAGMIRLTGLSSCHQEALRSYGLEGRFPIYGNLTDAVMGGCPRRPR